MPKSSKPVIGKHSSPVKGNRANVTKEGQYEETVTADTVDQIVESLNAPGSLSTKMAKGGNHGIKGDLFDNQILEIDRELNKFKILRNAKSGDTDNHTETASDFPNKDKEEINASDYKVVSEKGAGHVVNLSENPNIISKHTNPR
nr:hypothetical protein CFP56_13817 [Quercus suber]